MPRCNRQATAPQEQFNREVNWEEFRQAIAGEQPLMIM
uniref:Uncharacterized protein n=1 Tax=Leersia perrieri TaxID=77586 RepID=A0A0D9VP04_9ORYZ